MGEQVYNVNVSNTAGTYTQPKLSVSGISGSIGTTLGDWHIGDYWYPYKWWDYTYPQTKTIYKYQVACPSCKKNNWLELEVIIRCTGCRAKLKAVLDEADFTIPVSK